jgi:hypothetical protein
MLAQAHPSFREPSATQGIHECRFAIGISRKIEIVRHWEPVERIYPQYFGDLLLGLPHFSSIAAEGRKM